ncbi:MAG: tRNA (guanosine(37)-N1)-methyltransferase TrmD [Propionibacteriaceae bacterium]|jgi:tRNA (guanine37-N1)-methyltransferase|nr:tRNA (guanosine(37)-N1)-methyltransferase TrmD [Propionibacteriaceae bacterium]
MRLDVVTIFPAYFEPLRESLVGKAWRDGRIDVAVHDLRDFTHDVHRTVDDAPFGGGAGMVMKPEPWGEALDSLFSDPGDPASEKGESCIVFPSPSGVPFTQAEAEDLSRFDRLVFGCGRYEGIDARVADYASTLAETRELSLGDYVVNGGEVAALAMIEAVVRLLPEVIGNPESLREESHSGEWGNRLEYPLYTRPAVWRGRGVPEVLLSGHHARVAQWRREQALELTRRRRPDLLQASESNDAA